MPLTRQNLLRSEDSREVNSIGLQIGQSWMSKSGEDLGHALMISRHEFPFGTITEWISSPSSRHLPIKNKKAEQIGTLIRRNRNEWTNKMLLDWLYIARDRCRQ